MSCKCKMGLGSFSQCSTVGVELQQWKPEFLEDAQYLIPVGDEGDTFSNPYNASMKLVEDLSHMEPDAMMAELKAQESKASSNTSKFWLASAIAFIMFK